MKRFDNPVLAWLTCSLFFLFQYILRVSPSVMIEPLRQEFHVNADMYSTLGSYYLYAYALAQIPLGFLVDRYGIRRMTLLSLFVCCAGVVMGAHASAFFHVQIARIFIGLGSGIAFMGALKVASDAFAPGRRGIFMGLTLTLGTLGALVAGKPLVLLMDYGGWRHTLLMTGLVCLPLLVMAFLCLPSRQKVLSPDVFSQARSTLAVVIQQRNILIYTALAIGLYTPLSSLADLWGADFLMNKYSLSLEDAALANTMMYVGMAFGSGLLGWFFEARKAINCGIQMSGLALIFFMGFVLYGAPVGFTVLITALIGLGFFCGAEMLCFTGVSQYTTPETSGVTLGFVNTMNMMGGAVLQQVIGAGLDWQWSGGMMPSGLRAYAVADYQFALSSLLLIIVVCMTLSLFLRRPQSGA